MKTKHIFPIVLIAGILASCGGYEPDVPKLATDSWDMPAGLSSASAVVWSDTLYIMFGRSGQSAAKPHEYGYAVPLANPEEPRQFALPVKPRVKAAGVLYGDRYYFGLGFNGTAYGEESRLRDWWCMDMTTWHLSRLADYPGTDTDNAMAWNSGDSIFVSLGFSTLFSSRTYRYDIKADQWEEVCASSMPAPRSGITGGRSGGRTFAGGGRSTKNYNDWYEFNQTTYQWEPRKPMPTKSRLFAASACSDKEIYVTGGRHFGGTETSEYFYSSIMAYDADHDSWRVIGDMDEGAEHQIAFWHDGCLYWGLGQNGKQEMIRKLYRYRP